MTDTASSFALQRPEAWTVRAAQILYLLRAYEAANHPPEAACLSQVLRELESVLDPIEEGL